MPCAARGEDEMAHAARRCAMSMDLTAGNETALKLN
jgi:hypothetical protein